MLYNHFIEELLGLQGVKITKKGAAAARIAVKGFMKKTPFCPDTAV